MLPPEQHRPEPVLATRQTPEVASEKKKRRLWLLLPILLALAVIAVVAAVVWGHLFLQHAVRDNLPQLDGSAPLPGLTAPVSIQRDHQGVPHIHAQTLDDLVLAQAWTTAHDRLWQMDLLRRHAAGELAAILGPKYVDHDELQRTLQLRAAAERALTALPADQLHLLTVYAAGVNAAMEDQRAHLPVEFRVLRFQPEPWTPRDSVLILLVMFQDLSSNFQQKLDREALTARLPADLAADLYPIGSWRDHPPMRPPIDLTIEGPAIEDIPLDESQEGPWASLTRPSHKTILESIRADVDTLTRPPCLGCIAGSNNWAVAGARTASGKPMLSNDMHLSATVPGLWYEADLESPVPNAEPFHTAGVSLPGVPLIVVGHNAHIAWGYTNLGGDVQDLYIEQTRNNNQEFQSVDGSWQPILHLPETIQVHGAPAEQFDVLATRHGDAITPILTPALKNESRTIALRWTIYDPTVLRFPVLDICSAKDWASFTAAIGQFGGPSQNAVYADDQGHIGYHAIGRIPMRGQPAPAVPAAIASPTVNQDTQTSPTITANPDPLAHTDVGTSTTTALLRSGPLAAVPIVPDLAHEWSGYIPFDEMPQAFDPPGGIVATANARVAADDYGYPITLNWEAPYRNERIWKLLQGRHNLKPADMLAIQNDIYSEPDHVMAQRLAYALDHSPLVAKTGSAENQAALHQVADLLRTWNGNVETTSVAANIVAAARNAIWPMLLKAHMTPSAKPIPQDKDKAAAHTPSDDAVALYNWGERDYALEQLMMHTPQRWLPRGIASWDDLLVTALDKGLTDAHMPLAPKDLAAWTYGRTHVVDIEHPIFGGSKLLARLLAMRTGTGSHPLSGDRTTIKQVGKAFGPSERFTADFSNLDQSTLNVVLGQSGNPASPYFLDHFPAWYHGTSFPFAFSDAAVTSATTHTLTLIPN